ncbi:polyprenyl synthetase family protein (plasmid) [Streptomyces globisporus]|uniref:polyprenyl synthetase family protein n=1 Tax=Streptomyces globisporus TaxID=1908 RepID=UPI002F912FA8|nr:polyprenyl synthetase family protein [Streptomyces globisporus]
MSPGQQSTTHPRGNLSYDQRDRVDVPALLEYRRTRCAAGLLDAVDRLAGPLDAATAYHFGWLDVLGRPSGNTSGKALRPALALLSAEVTGTGDSLALHGAIALELLHNFSLVHDDLMDGDEQRRHRDTVWKTHGSEVAILVGDGLLSLAMEVILEAGSPHSHRAARTLTAAARSLIDGQARDLSYERRESVTIAECLQMAGEKTGALLGCSASIGAVLGGTDDRVRQALWEYGYHRGLSFQAVDDLLGIWGDPLVTGKQRWGDLRQRKKSLPVVAAAASEESTAGKRLRQLLADDARQESHAELTEEEMAMRAALIEEVGGRAWALQEARRRHRTGTQVLESISMPGTVGRQFIGLSDFVFARVA